MLYTVEVQSRRESESSTIIIERGGLDNVASRLHVSTFSKVVLVVDAGAAGFAAKITSSCGVSDQQVLELSGGEGCKDLSHLEKLWGFFQRNELDRKGLVIALGGGAITDLVGFAAATFMRGVPVSYIPTTLLAQVDASIGGKCAINFGGSKNIVGNFQLPRVVLIDPDVLSSLPTRELRSGFAEVIKHGALFDEKFFTACTEEPCNTLPPTVLSEIIARSCELKAAIVREDERELGPRKLLNFGHTLGHAIESICLKLGAEKRLLHGECVSLGMIGEAYISLQLGLISKGELERVETSIAKAGLPIRLPDPLPIHEVIAATRSDKKREASEIKWSLLEGIGRGVYDKIVPNEVVEKAVHYLSQI